MHVLIVDDDIGTCETLAFTFRTLGSHDVTTALTAEQGLAAARTHAFDVVIVDQYLQDHNGLNLLNQMRTSASAGARFYIYTAYGAVDEAVEAMRRGATNYLRKEACDAIELNRLISHGDLPKRLADRRIVSVLNLIAHAPVTAADTLAASVNLSESRLRHLFREQTGTDLGEYQHEFRLQRAALLLRTSFLTIQQIADRTGWSTAGAFTRAFVKRFGCTPSVYRATDQLNE